MAYTDAKTENLEMRFLIQFKDHTYERDGKINSKVAFKHSSMELCLNMLQCFCMRQYYTLGRGMSKSAPPPRQINETKNPVPHYRYIYIYIYSLAHLH